MGVQVDQVEFSGADYVAFERRLYLQLDQLRQWLEKGALCDPVYSLGAEVELVVADDAGRPLPLSQVLLAKVSNPRLQLEIDRFNLEYNLWPVPAEGKPFSAMLQDLDAALIAVRRAARLHDGYVYTIGILPTLTEGDLCSSAMTDLPRYQALSAALRQLRDGPFVIDIDGAEPLRTATDDVAFEGANTSFQVHMRTPANHFADLYNALQLATAPALALSTNSPLFASHRLWEETRIALFKQSVDGRAPGLIEPRRPPRVSFGHGWVRTGALELFAQAVALYPVLLPVLDLHEPACRTAQAGTVPPHLSELSLHTGTVWTWNRPVYDPSAGGHLRIEARALPAGPTPVDMMASAAYLLGLAHGLSPQAGELVEAMPFSHASWNFYRAAQYGLDAELVWPGRYRMRTLSARALAEELLPIAAHGLSQLGVDPQEATWLLDVIGSRLAHGTTGARWMTAELTQLETSYPRARALQALVGRYRELSTIADPVHTWRS